MHTASLLRPHLEPALSSGAQGGQGGVRTSAQQGHRGDLEQLSYKDRLQGWGGSAWRREGAGVTFLQPCSI